MMSNSTKSENIHKVRKLFICITKSNWGGAQKYVFDIATNTPRDQFDTTVLLGGNGDLKNKLEEVGIKTLLLINSQRDIDTEKEFGLLFELTKIFLKEKPDIVHLNSSKMGFTGALAARIAGVKKIIFTAHGWAFNEDRNFISKCFLKIIHILTVILCHEVISVSEITKKQIGKIFNKKITVIKNGLKNIVFLDGKKARETLSQQILVNNRKISDTLAKKPLWIGTISELHSNKGLEYAIEAISKIQSNVIFVIIGEGERRQQIEELIIKLGVKNKVCLLGKIDKASMYLKAFDIFTLTSITEALPYVLLEAGYASLPIIASNVGGIPEIIEDDKTGILVLPKNPQDIKHSIEYLINNPSKLRLYGDSIHNMIVQNYTQRRMLDETFCLYKKVV